MKGAIFVVLALGASASKGPESLPAWLPMAAMGFVEGFLSKNQSDVDYCIVAALGPMSDMRTGIKDIKAGIKTRNLTDIEEGVAALHNLLKDLPAAMKQCKAAEADVKEIVEVVKNFHGVKEILHHIEADLAADANGDIGRDFELMAKALHGKQYDDFGRYLGELLHSLVIGPEGALLKLGSSCSGSADPAGAYPLCYEGTAGALGVKEDVKVKLVTYASGKGTMDLVGSGIEKIDCENKTFTKSGQTISPDIADCLPSVITVKSVKYCSDSDTVAVTVKDKKIFIPVSATLKKVACASTTVVV